MEHCSCGGERGAATRSCVAEGLWIAAKVSAASLPSHGQKPQTRLQLDIQLRCRRLNPPGRLVRTWQSAPGPCASREAESESPPFLPCSRKRPPTGPQELRAG